MTCTTHFIDAGTTQFSPSRSPARHVQLVTLHRTCTDCVFFNILEVSRLDSTLSLFVIISSYIHTLSMLIVLEDYIGYFFFCYLNNKPHKLLSKYLWHVMIHYIHRVIHIFSITTLK